MKLYHGTTERFLSEILKNGLVPRSVSGCDSTFLEHPSHHECVYLTSCYAPYFAAVAARDLENWLLVEVEVDEDSLLPDEDFLEQATRRSPNRFTSMGEATAAFREDLFSYAQHALDSLRELGTVAIAGGVPFERITRIVSFDSTTNHYIAMHAMDPTITLMNHKILGEHYRALTRWFFDSDVVAKDLDTFAWNCLTEEQKQLRERMVNQRSGLEMTVFKKD